MNDEVSRLRGMRQAALQARALANVLTEGGRRDCLSMRAALVCWRIARVATGRLRAHPYTIYQRDPSRLEAFSGGLHALFAGIWAVQQQRRMSTLLQQLQSVSRLLDDARSLTLSPDLSDSLGRAQMLLRPLLQEIAARARAERGIRHESPASAPAIDRSGAASASPYLAL